MKILFVYFKEERMCETAQQAIDFINSLHCRNNPNCSPLSCNERVTKLMNDLFCREWNTDGPGYPFIEVEERTSISYSSQKYYDGFEVRTTGCSSTSIMGYYPLGDTIEAHKLEVARRKEEKAERSRIERDRELTQRYTELNEERKGWYSVSLTYERMRMHDMRMIETTFSGECIASSGMEAYTKAIQEIRKDGEVSLNASFPEPTSYHYNFLYLGVKTDDGYTFQELEEE